MWLPEATGLEFPPPGASSTWAGRSTSAGAVALLESAVGALPEQGLHWSWSCPPHSHSLVSIFFSRAQDVLNYTACASRGAP